MAINKAALAKICAEFEKENGEGSVFATGSSKSIVNIPRISTCIEDLDEVIGGGLPVGRIIEIFGPESSGKTSLCYWLASLFECCAYFPIEGTYDAERAKSIGVQDGQMLVYRCDYGEQVLNTTLKLARAGMPLIIIDSVPACQPKEDIEKLSKDAENETRIGGTARLFSKMLPIVVRECEKNGTILVLINQVRDKMNAMLFGDKDDTPGGRAIKFYSSIRIKVARRAWIEIPNKNPKISAANEKIGMIMKAKVVKSKVNNPFGECELPLMFDGGFVSFADVEQIRAERMAKNRKKKKKKREVDEDDEH